MLTADWKMEVEVQTRTVLDHVVIFLLHIERGKEMSKGEIRVDR